jgi:two-component sensor histidine kinase
MEIELKKSLNEKDILLKEVHHRVKNNMQIISSILNLQGKYIKDENDLGLFVDCTSRIQSMALVHEHLYRSDNLARIIFSDYIKTLIQSLTITYGVDSRRISITDHIDNVDLTIDLCIPCALLINEIVSNSLKHAFPDNMSGNISIQFTAEQQNMYTLTISDTGIGLPNDSDPESCKTLGLQLIQALVLQLNAELVKSFINGTKYIIRIPREKFFC